MPRNYYYLVAGLPDIAEDIQKKLPSVQDFLHDIIDAVDPDDRESLMTLLYSGEHQNICALLDEKPDLFKPDGLYTRESLQTELRSPDTLPSYVQEYLELRRSGAFPVPGLLAEDQLNYLLYTHVCKKYDSGSFLNRYFSFDCALRNVLSILNIRKLKESPDSTAALSPVDSILPIDEISEQIRTSNLPDMGIGSHYPWIERLLAQDKSNLPDYDRLADTIRWEFLDECTIFSYFSLDAIMAFIIKLGIVSRRQSLSDELGSAALDTLLTGLTAGGVPADF